MWVDRQSGHQLKTKNQQKGRERASVSLEPGYFTSPALAYQNSISTGLQTLARTPEVHQVFRSSALYCELHHWLPFGMTHATSFMILILQKVYYGASQHLQSHSQIPPINSLSIWPSVHPSAQTAIFLSTYLCTYLHIFMHIYIYILRHTHPE